MTGIEELLKISVRNARTDPRSGAVIMNSMDEFGKLWFLERFPGLSDDEIARLQMEYIGNIPDEFLDFLRITNGLNVMGRVLKIAGMDRDREKLAGSRVADPIRFVDGHRTRRTPKSWLFFATYTQWEDIGMAHVCMVTAADGDKSPVYCLPYNGDKILKRWDSFGSWLEEEFTRLYNAYREGTYRLVDVVPGVVQMVELNDCILK
jgi:hypothetical protein